MQLVIPVSSIPLLTLESESTAAVAGVRYVFVFAGIVVACLAQGNQCVKVALDFRSCRHRQAPTDRPRRRRCSWRRRLDLNCVLHGRALAAPQPGSLAKLEVNFIANTWLSLIATLCGHQVARCRFHVGRGPRALSSR